MLILMLMVMVTMCGIMMRLRIFIIHDNDDVKDADDDRFNNLAG